MINPLSASGDDRHRPDVDGNRASGRAFEPHFTPKEIAKLWHKDEDTIRRIFRIEPGVLCLESMFRRKGSRRYVSLSIPESVVVRVHQRLEIQANSARKPRFQTSRATHTDETIQSTSINSAPQTCEDPRAVDEEWERELLLKARKLRNRDRDQKK